MQTIDSRYPFDNQSLVGERFLMKSTKHEAWLIRTYVSVHLNVWLDSSGNHIICFQQQHSCFPVIQPLEFLQPWFIFVVIGRFVRLTSEQERYQYRYAPASAVRMENLTEAGLDPCIEPCSGLQYYEEGCGYYSSGSLQRISSSFVTGCI